MAKSRFYPIQGTKKNTGKKWKIIAISWQVSLLGKQCGLFKIQSFLDLEEATLFAKRDLQSCLLCFFFFYHFEIFNACYVSFGYILDFCRCSGIQ